MKNFRQIFPSIKLLFIILLYPKPKQLYPNRFVLKILTPIQFSIHFGYYFVNILCRWRKIVQWVQGIMSMLLSWLN